MLSVAVRFIEELAEQQQEAANQSPGSSSLTGGGAIPDAAELGDLESLDLSEDDTEFLKRWAETNKEFTQKQNISYRMMVSLLQIKWPIIHISIWYRV